MNSTSWIAFDGQELGQPLRVSHTIYGLTTGRDYLVSVVAISVNGDGNWSDPPVRLYSCVAPSQAIAPKRIDSTIDSISISWEPHAQNGGCDILGYAVYVDDGAGGSY